MNGKEDGGATPLTSDTMATASTASNAVPVNNLGTGSVLTDKLVAKRDLGTVGCSRDRCLGALMGTFGKAKAYMNKNTQIKQARDFMLEFHKENGRMDSFETRWREVVDQIEATGLVDFTEDELIFGSRTAWRNAPRCSGRSSWNSLVMRDCRNITSVDEMFKEICVHIKESSNNGIIVPTISIFPPRKFGKPDSFRIWNPQLFQFAGYDADDGSWIGDKANIGFTKFCMELGWKGKGGRFDMLPLVLSGPDGAPVWFEIPEDITMIIKIKHPNYPAIGNLGLQWYGLPAVSGMLLEMGGVQFPACPFSGWYATSEVATRDLLDLQRYNLMQEIATALGLDTSNHANMWKEKVNTELTIAVLDSYKEAGVAMVDHFTLADQFIAHFQQEHRIRGGCPADWVWVTAPMSSGLTPIFHQEMVNYHLSPSYEYQDSPWIKYEKANKGRFTVGGMGKAFWFMTALFLKRYKLRPKAYIFYGTMTGTSKLFAATLERSLNQLFQTFLQPLNDDSLDFFRNINRDDSVVFVVTSTTGQGEAPSHAVEFRNKLETAVAESNPILAGLQFAVFGLGASTYEDFCAFGKMVDKSLQDLGGVRLIEVGLGDQQKCQDRAFKTWSKMALQSACFAMNIPIPTEVNVNWPFAGPKARKASWAAHSFKSTHKIKDMQQYHGSRMAGVELMSTVLIAKKQLSTRYVMITIGFPRDAYVFFEPGDHIYIFPENDKDKVSKIMTFCSEKPRDGELTIWIESDVPPSSLRRALSSYVDISNCPTQEMIQVFAKFAVDEAEADKLQKLANDLDVYLAFKATNPDLLDLFLMHPNLRVPASVVVASLNKLLPRPYSIASVEPRRSLVSGKLIPVTDILFELFEVRTEIGHDEVRVKKGVCTDFLNRLQVGNTFLTYRSTLTSHFKMPDDPNLPLIMIAAGSGIAPFRAFWQLRSVRQWPKSGAHLYFGCRDSSENLFLKESERVLNRKTAFSRQNGQDKVYVQDLLADNDDLIYNLIVQQKACIFICGKVGMKTGVMTKLAGILKKHGNFANDKDVDEQIHSLKREGKIIEEFFG